MGVDKMFVVEYNVTTHQEIADAIGAGKLPILYYGEYIYIFARNNGANIYFTCAMDGRIHYIRVDTNNAWSGNDYICELVSNKKTTITGNESSSTYYPTTKAVADYAEKKTDIVAPVNTTDATLPITTLSCEVGKYYRIDVAVDTLAITLPAVTDTTHISNIVFMLTTGSTPAVTFTAPSGVNVYYQNGYAIEAGKTYEINCLWNGSTWIVAAVEIIVPEAEEEGGE